MKTHHGGILYRLTHGAYKAQKRTQKTVISLSRIHGVLSDPILSQTCYPNEERKSRIKIYLDNIFWALRHAEVNEYYFAYGLDRKHGVDCRQYLGLQEGSDLLLLPNLRSWTGSRRTDYRCLCKDKFVFGAYVTSMGFPTPKILALYHDQQLVWLDQKGSKDLESLLEEEYLDVFCKDAVGDRGRGVFSLKMKTGRVYINEQVSDIAELRKMLPEPAIIQARLTQHAKMARLHPPSVNTLRIITIMRDGHVAPLGAIVRMGTKGSVVDNTSAGGLAVGLDLATGRMCKQAFYAPGRGGSATEHPETGVRFEGFEVPLFKDAVDMSLGLHRFFYGLFSLAWDIAITLDGPVFIEGNHLWDFRGLQSKLGGLRNKLQV